MTDIALSDTLKEDSKMWLYPSSSSGLGNFQPRQPRHCRFAMSRDSPLFTHLDTNQLFSQLSISVICQHFTARDLWDTRIDMLQWKLFSYFIASRLLPILHVTCFLIHSDFDPSR
jgi:hypothetical protein